MKIIHTADWHLGQTFCGYDRAKEHRAFLEFHRQCHGCLEQLQNSRRCICVISHLTEMLDRIPVKIKVSGRGKGKSRIEIIG